MAKRHFGVAKVAFSDVDTGMYVVSCMGCGCMNIKTTASSQRSGDLRLCTSAC